ncbi:hypothetical protein SSS_02288 [Sarcoptes scabiei]|uniref:Uncharacterized protein n=1 Tax=Sarcoptes scabiei TaxID=52283 RepID=A0A834RG73_SARSC|nr:hypothetical protein SSS_02288 [Sarcoptes scabiei]
MRFDPIEVIEIKCSLHQGFESVKPIESLDQTEIVPKDFTKIGLSSYLDENWNEIDEMVQSNRDESSFTHQEWDQFYCQIKQLLFSLQNKFNQSDWTFLTLHRHLKLIHEDMIQFNVEIKKLSDWFENVELQINNGRVTMIDFDSLDQERFEKSELYLNVVARTQSLLITQFRTHLPSYGRLMMLYERILKHFTPETSEHFKEYRLDLKALLEAKNRIKHEMISIQKRWKIIVRELAWHLDELVKNHVQNELDHKDYRDSYPLDQLKQWFVWIEQELVIIRSETKLIDLNDYEQLLKLYQRLKRMEQEMYRHYLNCSLLTERLFQNQTDMIQLDENERVSIQKKF